MSLKDSEARIAALEHDLLNIAKEDSDKAEQLIKKIERIKKHAYTHMDAWDVVYLARHPKRPKAMDYIQALFPDFIELHGDRLFGDDGACQGGIASIGGIPVTIIAQSKGKTLDENMKRNFGMLHPEGYRKAIRLAKQAERFHRPIITLVDTSGAYPGKGAEERGQAEAIANCLELFSRIKTPVLAIVLSEGGSGGALAFSVADHILMLENAIYSILSPEGFASILWKDSTRVQEAANVMELTAKDLMRKGIVDTMIEEPLGGAHICFDFVIVQLREKLMTIVPELMKKREKVLLQERYDKFRKLGYLYENM